jgi:hypothetical protein
LYSFTSCLRNIVFFWKNLRKMVTLQHGLESNGGGTHPHWIAINLLPYKVSLQIQKGMYPIENFSSAKRHLICPAHGISRRSANKRGTALNTAMPLQRFYIKQPLPRLRLAPTKIEPTLKPRFPSANYYIFQHLKNLAHQRG